MKLICIAWLFLMTAAASATPAAGTMTVEHASVATGDGARIPYEIGTSLH